MSRRQREQKIVKIIYFRLIRSLFRGLILNTHHSSNRQPIFPPNKLQYANPDIEPQYRWYPCEAQRAHCHPSDLRTPSYSNIHREAEISVKEEVRRMFPSKAGFKPGSSARPIWFAAAVASRASVCISKIASRRAKDRWNVDSETLLYTVLMICVLPLSFYTVEVRK